MHPHIVSLASYDHGAFYPGFIVPSVGPEAGGPDYVGVAPALGYSANVGWCGTGDYGAPAMGDGDYFAAFRDVVLPLARAFRPQLVLVAAGFDAARGDPLGECDVTPRGYASMTQQLVRVRVDLWVFWLLEREGERQQDKGRQRREKESE